jgi:hypothetical protein
MRQDRSADHAAPNDPRQVELAQLVLFQSRSQLRTELEFLHWSSRVALLAANTLGHLAAEDLQGLWIEPQWVAAELQAREDVGEILAVYRATALRDVAAMRPAAEQVLVRHGKAMAPEMREQMLVIAMLGALGMGDAGAVMHIEQTLGKDVLGSRELGPIRAFLLAWADGPVPACMAGPVVDG